MFKDRTIEKRVMEGVRAAIETAQGNFDADVLAAEGRLASAVGALHETHREHVSTLADLHVKSVFKQLA